MEHMKDLTKNSIAAHIITMAAPIAISSLVQLSYQWVDLYFIAKVGLAATAGVSAASNVALVFATLSQVLGVGTVALIAHAAGRKEQGDANLIFNQALALSTLCGAATIALIGMGIRPYLTLIAADTETIDAGVTFTLWVSPGYALMLPMTVITSALRGIGVVRPIVAFQLLTVGINAALAPILISGWGTGAAFGVKGAGLATSISLVVGTALSATYFHRLQNYVGLKAKLLCPRTKQCWRLVAIGAPVGGETVLVFLYIAVVYYAIRNLGTSAQAGFGIGMRILQTVLLPGISIALAVGPIAGQNFGAGCCERVRSSFRYGAVIGTAVMMAATIIVQCYAASLVSAFNADSSTATISALFLEMMSLTFVAQGLVYTCGGVFQGLGNTAPTLITFGARFLLFATLSVWLSTNAWFEIEQLWGVWNATVILQAAMCLWLLHLEFKKRLRPPTR
jgi:putative MATE family efflux protein